MYYSQSFLDDPLAFSLRVEFDDPSGPAGLIRLLARDNGDNAIATANDPWGRILAIKEHYPSVKTIFDAASEISVFVDDSSSLQGQTQMEKTIIRMGADAISSGYTIAGSTDNTNEDIICPFAQSQCCTENAQPLMNECGVDVDCGALSLSFTKSPDDALIREYCTNIFLPESPFYSVCDRCISQQEEQGANTIEYTALAANSQGQNADFVEIRYSLQASDNGTDWVTIENLDNGFSGTQQGLNALIDNWGGSSLDPDDCHQWLSDNTGACLLYQDVTVGNCDRRIWTRQFRIKAETIGYPLTAFSDTFKIYELRFRGGTSYLTADGEWVGGAGFGDGFTLNPDLPLGGATLENNNSFGDSVYTEMVRGFNNEIQTYYPQGEYWVTDPLNRRLWKMRHDGDESRSAFDPFKATLYEYPISMSNPDPYIVCDGILLRTGFNQTYYNPNNNQSISSTVWSVRNWADSYNWGDLYPHLRQCQSIHKGGVVSTSPNNDINGYGFFITDDYDLDSNVIITPFFRTSFMDFSYRSGSTRRWYDVFISGTNVANNTIELRYYKVWIDTDSIAEFGQLSLISTLETPNDIWEITLDYSDSYTIDDTNVFADAGGFLRLSNISGSTGAVIYYFGGDDWRIYSSNFSSIQSELYPEKAADGSYLYRPWITGSNWVRSVGNGRYILQGDVYSQSESKYYTGIFVLEIYLDPFGNTAIVRYGKPVASFVEDDGFGERRFRADSNINSLVVGAPDGSPEDGDGAVYYYMWTPNI